MLYIYIYHLREMGGTGQTGPLRSGRTVKLKGAAEASIPPCRRHRVLQGEEDGTAQEQGRLTNAL